MENFIKRLFMKILAELGEINKVKKAGPTEMGGITILGLKGQRND